MKGERENRGARSGKKNSVVFAGTMPKNAALVACCVDDTDDLSGDTSTGYVAEQIARKVAELGGCVVQGITRHQLLVAEGVPYTSHNSAMCFLAWLPKKALDDFELAAIHLVREHSVSSADPGLCVVEVLSSKKSARSFGLCLQDDIGCHSERSEESLRARRMKSAQMLQALIEFGRAAQTRLCTKQEAYQLGESLGVRLTEHGGTGDGVIGALAGAGLRLSGEDGRFRGTWDLVELFEACAYTPTVKGFCEVVADMVHGAVVVTEEDGTPVPERVPLMLVRKTKPVLRNGALCFKVTIADGVATIKEPEDNAQPGEKRRRELEDAARAEACERFELDNDVEECAPELARSCRNCLYRYWTEDGFACTV